MAEIASVTISVDDYFDLRSRADAIMFLTTQVTELQNRLYEIDKRLYELESRRAADG